MEVVRGALRMQVYIIWSILLIVYLILIVVTSFITIALVYFMLAVEDHRRVCAGHTLFGGRADRLGAARAAAHTTRP